MGAAATWLTAVAEALSLRLCLSTRSRLFHTWLVTCRASACVVAERRPQPTPPHSRSVYEVRRGSSQRWTGWVTGVEECEEEGVGVGVSEEVELGEEEEGWDEAVEVEVAELWREVRTAHCGCSLGRMWREARVGGEVGRGRGGGGDGAGRRERWREKTDSFRWGMGGWGVSGGAGAVSAEMTEAGSWR